MYFDSASLGQLRTAVAAWYGASGLSCDAFRELLLDPTTSDVTVDRLRRAARGMVEGRTPAQLAAAGKDLAGAVQQIGRDRWPRCLADAQARAVASVAAGGVPGVVRASATGTGTATAVVLGGLALLYMVGQMGLAGRPGVRTAPSRGLFPRRCRR